MKQSERASIMRVVTDLIEADGIIDTREISFFEALRNKYGIKKEDEVRAASLTLSDALKELSVSEERLKQALLEDFTEIAMSDDICAREEALLILAIQNCLKTDFDLQVSVISLNANNLNFERSQVLYVESEYDKKVNEQILQSYREIRAELRLAGFDFVYLPQIAQHYRSITTSALMQIMGFLYPKVSSERLSSIVSQIQHLSTERFCKEQLTAKLGIQDLSSVVPSLMVKIGESYVDENKMTNFMLIEVDDDVLGGIRATLDTFAKSYRNERLNYLTEEEGRFVFKGFHKLIFDILMLRKGIQSKVVIDTYDERIYFPEADTVIDKIHRREKALYALFLIEARNGGVNFNKPASPKQFERYKSRMATIQAKYKMIYRMFGGDPNTAPNLESADIRSPMLSLLKRQILKLGDVLCNVNDYIVQRNAYGNYSVNLSADLCYSCEKKGGELVPLSSSDIGQRVASL